MKALLLVFLLSASAWAGEEHVTHRITGLFSPSREADLRASLEKLPGVRLESMNFERAEGVFAYDPAVAFPGTKPEKLVEAFDQKLGSVSHQTFGIQPLVATPPEQLTRLAISVRGLDCKACALATYEAIYKLPGVAQATVDFRTGAVIALIDPQKADEATLKEALKKKSVTLAETPGK